MGKVDLHVHSSVSDGVLSPVRVIEKAAELGLSAIALTDHDNVDGIAPAKETAARYPNLRFIPGIEISTDIKGGEIHMLGYFIDHTDDEFRTTLERMIESRVTRAKKMIDRLRNLNIIIEWERVRELAGPGSVGRPHIAQALLEKGYITDIQEAFTRFLAFNGPAYVHRDKMTPAEAIRLIKKAGGIPVFAHPLSKGNRNPEKLTDEFVKAGLAGIEAYYKDYGPEEREKLVRLAAHYGLITTGGSDYHGLDDKAEVMMGEANVPQEVVDSLFKLAGTVM
ncbi:MAG: PHP domain-containing protein [Dehalococcoidales bacterium]|nr:PHP domain-containing protein [Dehalococcoidales bacterium]